jgi:ATP-dependent Clp protease ATP-binding subunit ClpC
VFLQILDDGRVTDGQGRTVNFSNTLIVMTSNLGSHIILGERNPVVRDAKIQELLRTSFKPEFLNRIDESIIFNSLTKDDINKIIYNEVDQVRKRLVEIGYKLEIDTNAVEFLAKEGYDENYGARPLARTIQRYVEDQIADEILSSNINEGETIKITFDTDKSEIIVKSEKAEKPKK